MGFADGFRTGYGIVADNQDRELKKTQLENAQSNADRSFGAAEEDRESTAAYRAEDLRIKNINAGADAEYKLGQLGIQKTQAETANISATTAQTKSDRLNDPNSPESKKLIADIASQEAATASSVASTNKTVQETDVAEGNNRATEAAILIDDVFTKSKSASGRASNSLSDDLNAAYDGTKGTILSMGTMLSDTRVAGEQAVNVYIQDLQAGLEPEMSSQVKQAFSESLGLNDSKALGRQVTDEFKNAPVWMHNKGLIIKSQGLWNVQADAKQNLSGQLYVFVEDKDGNEYPYFPPLTANRNNLNNKPLNLTLTEAVQATAAVAHMGNAIRPLLKPLAKQARIQKLYGNRTGDNGEEEFQTRVSSYLETNRKAIQNGDNTYNMIGMDVDMSELPAGTVLSETQVATMKNNIEERMLFGSKHITDQDRVAEWLESTTTNLKSAPFSPAKEVDPKKPKRRNEAPETPSNLGALVPEGKWSPRLVSELQGYYDENNEIEDQAGLTALLTEKGWIK
ncbi:MAG: hypothetical protein OSA04_03275 [Flavobacteriales bacterium]|nr:hypothetical protein [Flavobacteriales bacterium]